MRRLSVAVGERLTALEQQVACLTRDVEQTERHLLLLVYRLERLDRLECRLLRAETAGMQDEAEATGRRQDGGHPAGRDALEACRAIPPAPERTALLPCPSPGTSFGDTRPGPTASAAGSEV